MKHFRDWEGSTALAGFNPRLYVKDAFQTFDQQTIDSAGAFLIGELERLDPMIHEPLVAVTWSRDIDLRTDVQIGDTTSSYTTSTFASVGGAISNGINWASPELTAIPRVTVDIQKIVNPINLVAYEIAYSIPDLKSAELTGRPLDVQMLKGMNLKNQMDIDSVVYVGDTAIGTTGLVNNTAVTNSASVSTGASASTLFTSKSPDEILSDINEMLVSAWAATGYSMPPTKLLLAPVPFGYISTTPLAIGGTGVAETILSFVKTRNILTADRGMPLEIQSCKWLDKTVRGVSNDRMMAYVQRNDFIRFPMVPLQPVQPQAVGIWIRVPYYGRLGAVEIVYPEATAYRDGI